MKIKHKNYPHPILSPYSDDISSPLRCNVDVEWDKSYYYFRCDFRLENETMIGLIRGGRIQFIVHVECGKTFYRKAHRIDACDFTDNHILATITIPATRIKDSTEVSVFVCSTSEVAKYMPVGMHADYGSNSFILENGDFVATWQTYKFDLYQDYDPIRKADSIISFQRDENRDTGEITVDPVNDKLTAYLPKDIHQTYNDLKADKRREDILLSMLGVPILMEGLSYIKENSKYQDGVDLSACRRHRWFRSLEKKLADMGIDIQSQECLFAVAQKIFENPCKKAGMRFEEIDEASN